MLAIDMILQSIQTVNAYSAFETIEVPKHTFGDDHVPDACRE